MVQFQFFGGVKFQMPSDNNMSTAHPPSRLMISQLETCMASSVISHVATFEDTRGYIHQYPINIYEYPMKIFPCYP